MLIVVYIVAGLVVTFIVAEMWLKRRERGALKAAPEQLRQAQAALTAGDLERAATLAAPGLIVPHQGRFPSLEATRTVGELARLLADVCRRLETPMDEILLPLAKACENGSQVPALFVDVEQLRAALTREGEPLVQRLRAFRQSELGTLQKKWLADLQREATKPESLQAVDLLLEGKSGAWRVALFLTRGHILNLQGAPPDEIIAAVESSVKLGLVLSPAENDLFAEEQLMLLAIAYDKAGRHEEAESARADMKRLAMERGMTGRG